MGRSGTITVLFTDIVGSTETLGRLGDRAWNDLLRDHLTILRSVLADHHGTEVKNTGDGIMAVFASAVDGANAAVAMQRAVQREVTAGAPVRIRVGLATGEARSDHGDWFGTPVVEAARLCALAGTDQTWSTALVKVLAGTETDARFVPIGSQTLKGFDDPIDVFSLEPRVDVLGSWYIRPDLDEELGERLVASLDAWEGLPSIQRMRATARAALAPITGDVVCDIGCGAGTELAHLARIVGPSGTAIGVDPNPRVIQECQRRTEAQEVDVELIARDGRDTGLPDHHCDGVRIERVIQHVGDLDAFVSEAVRITRPGGRVVLVDTDWGSMMIHPVDPDFLRRTQAAFEHNVMTEPWAGRQLTGALLEHGLTDVETTICVIEAGADFVVSVATIYARLVEARVVTEGEVDTQLGGLRDALERGTGVVAFCMFVASGRVPG